MSAPRKSFDAATIVLAGKNLVEASAGTGKTYAITTLFVRLLLEKSLEPSQIAAVTFTDAATAELRDRVRRRLIQAEAAFVLVDSGGKPKDEVLAAIAHARRAHIKADLARLRVAIENIDEAVISTIHGFCQRMLVESAFGTGSLFDAKLETDLTALYDDVVYDFWHREIAGSDVLSELAWSSVGVGDFRKLLGVLRRNPRVHIQPDAPPAGAEKRFADALNDVRSHKFASGFADYLGSNVTYNRLPLETAQHRAISKAVDAIIAGTAIRLPAKAENIFPDRIRDAWNPGTKRIPIRTSRTPSSKPGNVTSTRQNS